MIKPFTGSAHTHRRGSAPEESGVPQAWREVGKNLVRARRRAALAGALALLAPLAAFAPGRSAVPARITDRIDNNRMVTLTGNTHPLARAQYDQGAAPSDLPMNRMMLVLKRSADQESALQDLLTQQQVTASPNFHKWLTPDQFGQQFGPADADIQAITSWLASYGFQSIKVSKGRTVIEFSGTSAQVQASLHASIHKYVVNGAAHWANANDPQIPAALAPVVAGVASLHNFPKRPASVRFGQEMELTRASDGKPQFTSSGTPASHALAPADFDTIYNVSPSMTGSGVTIGVIARSNIVAQDVTDFRNQFHLGGSGPTIILNGPDPGDLGGGEEAEAVLDATWPGAVAPAASVDLVVSEATNAAAGEDLSEFYIVDNNLADVMTESFSVCEAVFGTQLSSAASFYSSVAEQAAAQGITYLVASGDSGPDSCDDPNSVPNSLQPASVNLLAATPYTVAVGGTQFNDLASPSTYWNAADDPNTLGSAKSYIPENVWNESCTEAQCPGLLNSGLWSSGGGQSLFFAKPPWQAGVAGIPAGNRALPDVSINAAEHDGYLLCLDASCQGIGCPPPGTGPCFSVLSGTSASAQAFGGVMALVVQKAGARVGIANYSLYNLAANQPPTLPLNSTLCDGSSATLPAGSCIFHDVTVGNTNIPEVNPLEMGFTAGVGFDQATGLGSVNITNLVNQWHTSIVNASVSTLSLNPASTTHGRSVNVNVTVAPVAPATGTPTGDVSLVANSLTGQGADFFPLTNGTATWSTIFLPGGTYQVHAHYEGDQTFMGSDSAPVNVTIAPEGSRTSLGVTVTSGTTCSTTTSIPYGSSYVLTVVVSDPNAVASPCSPNESGSSPTGSIALTDSFNGGAALPLDGGSFNLNSLGTFEDQQIQLSVGTHNIQAAYAGDNSFSASKTSAPSVTVTKAPTTVTATPSVLSASATTSFSIMVVVDTQNSTNPPAGSSGTAPTGSVTFSVTTTSAGSFPPGRNWPQPNRQFVDGFFVTVGCLFVWLAFTKTRPAWMLSGLALVFVAVVIAGCGSSGTTTSSTTTMQLGTVSLSAMTDANGFAAAAATLSNVKLAATGRITATYSGDGNYSGATSSVVTVSVQ